MWNFYAWMVLDYDTWCNKNLLPSKLIKFV
jgi:hypothetical protein